MNLAIHENPGPTLLFIHGFCETQNIWKPYVDVLKDDFQIVTLDLPGHGQSPLTLPSFTIDDIADQIISLLKELRIEKIFPIGHSLGGYIGLALEDLYPQYVTGFGLFSSTTYPDDDEKKKVRDKVGEFITEHGHSNFIDSFVPNLFTPENRRTFAEEIETLKKEAYLTNTESIVAYSQAMKNRPDRTQLLISNKPKLIIAGDRDMAVKIDKSRQMMQYIPQSDGLILEDIGHNGFIEAKEQSLEFITQFLSRYESSL